MQVPAASYLDGRLHRPSAENGSRNRYRSTSTVVAPQVVSVTQKLPKKIQRKGEGSTLTGPILAIIGVTEAVLPGNTLESLMLLLLLGMYLMLTTLSQATLWLTLHKANFGTRHAKQKSFSSFRTIAEISIVVSGI